MKRDAVEASDPRSAPVTPTPTGSAVLGAAEGRERATGFACQTCEDPEGHQYDDDRHCLLFGVDGPWAKVGDPCMWCDHSKCEACPPPRGGTFAEEHAAGRERCLEYACCPVETA